MSAAAEPVPRRTFLALLSGVAAFSVLQSMVLPALPAIRADLHASATASSWVLSAFLLVSSVAAVVCGRLGDMIGKKRLLLVSVGMLLTGSVVAATAPSLGVLVAGRAVQGVGAAAFPLAYGLAREIFPPARVPVVIGAVSSTFGVGFAVGLVLPAPLLAVAGWPAIFWLSALVDVIALVLIARTVDESPVRARGTVDWWGAALLTTALTSLLLAISEARAWPPTAVVSAGGLGALALGLFVLVELRTAEPLVQPRLLARRPVAAADAAALLVGFALYGAFSVIPQFVQAPAASGYGFGATSLEAGLLLVPTAVVMIVVGPLGGRLGTRFSHHRTLIAAGLIGAAGYAVPVLAPGSVPAILVCAAVLGVAVGLSLTAVTNLIVGSVDPADTGQATGLNTILRTIGGAVGAQLSAVFVAAAADGPSPGNGYRTAFLASGIALVLTAAVTALLVRGPVAVAGRPAPQPAPS